MAEMNIANGIREFARCTPRRVAVIDGQRQLTFAELDDRSSRLASALLAVGLRAGDRVAMLSRNRLEFVELAAGLAKAGLPMVPLNPRGVAREHEFILEHSKARALIVDDQLLAGVGGITDGLAITLILGSDGPGQPYERFLSQALPQDPGARPSEREAFCVQYTSGTTGKPKGVMLSHRSRVFNMFAGGLEWGIGPGRRTAAIAPMALGAGFLFGYMGPFLGGTTVMLAKWDAADFLDLCERHKLQSVFLVPTHAQGIRSLGEDPAAHFDLSSLETLYFNAAALPVPLKKWVIDAFPGAGVHELYGSTEAAVVTDLRPDRALDRAGSVGHPWFSTEVKLVDPDGVEVPAGQPGELFSRSPMLMNGYLDDPEATAAALTDDGWCTAGDVAIADDEGFIYIVDRKKDMIVSGSLKIYPREIENVLIHAPGVSEVAVVGIPDDTWGERVCAFVVRDEPTGPSADALAAFARDQLAGFKIPREWHFAGSLPRNANGKVMKNLLRDQAAADGSR
ncbi:MAG TPA: AMP-binding protein [Streptosporangiaceae bacterium]|nr:AMP-binding protein [Streptosporangiaceae bacterium]